MASLMTDSGGAGSFDKVRQFLMYVDGSSGGAEGVPAAIVADLVELEERTRRVRAMTGVMPAAELSPYVLELLRAAGGSQPEAAEGVLNAAGA